MNILLLYQKEVLWTAGRYFEKSLRKKHNVDTFDIFHEQYYLHYFNIAMQRGFVNLGKFNFNIPSINGTFKKKTTNILSVIEKCKRQPDLIIEIDGGGYCHLEGYKDIDIPKVYWAINSHDSYKFKIKKIIIHDFDYKFIAQKEFVPLFKEIVDNVFWLPLAADPDIHKRYNVPQIFDVGFVGSSDPRKYLNRMKILNKLSKRYSVLSVEGIWGKNMSKIYNISKIGFNMSLAGDLNMRVFEVMSCGTMLLTDRIENGITDLFKDKKHFVMYKDEEELNELIQYYLINGDEREKIAKEGQKEVHENHTYDNRVQYMLDKIKV